MHARIGMAFEDAVLS